MRLHGGNLVTALALVALNGCGSRGDNLFTPDVKPGAASVVTITPEATGDGWRTSTPAAEGMNGQALLDLMQSIHDGGFSGVDSIVVVKNNALIAEGYFNGYDRDTIHDVRSASKSITSALTGIAISQGLFGVDELIARLIPNFDSYANMDANKSAITVFNLLNMNSGLDCNDWDPSSPGAEVKMYETGNWIRFILNLPMAYTPGVAASYCSGGVDVLGNIVATRAGVPLDDFANAWLFGPLGIHDVSWLRSPDGQATGGGGMRLRPRDLAKFGSLFVNGGRWNDVQIVPEQWVEQSKRRVDTLGQDGYGFNWWKRTFDVKGEPEVCTFAWGNGGNFIFLLPLHQLVVVVTASNYNTERIEPGFEILGSTVLPALE